MGGCNYLLVKEPQVANQTDPLPNLGAEGGITSEHVKNNEEIRRLLKNRGIMPEKLPPAEDVKKVERRLQSEKKKLAKGAKRLNLPKE